MKTFLKLTAAPAALCALAFVSFATPASAGEYCRRDVTAAMLQCGFDTLAQCQDMSSGRGGDCVRNPSPGDVANAYAYAPIARQHRRK